MSRPAELAAHGAPDPEAEAWAQDRAAPIALVQAMSIARAGAAELSGKPVDSVVSAEAAPDGWRVQVDVVEGPARMGNNDLLATYDLRLAPDGALVGFDRVRRYHRED